MFGLALLFADVFFCPFSILITVLGEEGAGLCAYRANFPAKSYKKLETTKFETRVMNKIGGQMNVHLRRHFLGTSGITLSPLLA